MNNHNLIKLKKLTNIPAQPVVFTKSFEKDFKKLTKSGNYDLNQLKLAIEMVRHGCTLPRGYDAHRLIFINNEIDIHILSDWVLLYKRKQDSSGKYIKLYRTGPHSWIFK